LLELDDTVQRIVTGDDYVHHQSHPIRCVICGCNLIRTYSKKPTNALDRTGKRELKMTGQLQGMNAPLVRWNASDKDYGYNIKL
jgi:hypothetical protein